jgi:hypothetical protein
MRQDRRLERLRATLKAETVEALLGEFSITLALLPLANFGQRVRCLAKIA